MANTAINIPFYVANAGAPLTGAAAQMQFITLKTVGGTDKISSAPTISEIGGGWYKFSVAFGTAPFDGGDLVGVIDADFNGSNGLVDNDRYIAVEARLDFYALQFLVNTSVQNKSTGNITIKDSAGNVILHLNITDGQSTLTRAPASS